MRRQVRRFDHQLLALPSANPIADRRRRHPFRRSTPIQVNSTDHIEGLVDDQNLMVLLYELQRSPALGRSDEARCNTPHARIIDGTIESGYHLLRCIGWVATFPRATDVHGPDALQSSLLRSGGRH